MSMPKTVEALARTASVHSIGSLAATPAPAPMAEELEEEDPPPTGLGPVYASIVIDAAGLAMCIPVLPYFILALPGGSASMLGLSTSVFSFASVIGVAVNGRLSDMMGRRPLILFSIAGSGFGFIFTAMSTSIPTLLAARIFAGLVSGSIPVAQAYITDVTTPRQRTKYLGLTGACIGISFTVGPAVGALLTTIPGFTPQRILLSAGGFSMLAFMQALLRLEEPQKKGGGAVGSQGPSAFQVLTSSRPIQILFFVTFCVNYNFQVMQTLYALLIADFFDAGPPLLGGVLFGGGLVLVAVQGLIIGPLTTKVGNIGAAVLACIVLTVFGVLFPMFNTPALLIPHIVLLWVYCAGSAISNTSVPALLAGYADPSQIGLILGLGQSVAAISRVVAPIVSGWLYEVSMEPAYEGLPFVSFGQLPFLVGSILTLIAGFVVHTLKGNPPKAAEERGPDPAKLAGKQELSEMGEPAAGA